MDPSDPAYKGQSGYTPRFLSTYDRWVLGFMAPRVWHSPVAPVVDRYRQSMGGKHLDIGPGTGFFIRESGPHPDKEITLLDPNPHVLDHAFKELAGMNVRCVEGDVLKPLPVEGPFDSVGFGFVLHCLPGPPANKAVAIRHIAAVTAREGVLFGSTVLGEGGDHSGPARLFLKIANWQGGFDNLGDTADGLEDMLHQSFHDVDVEVNGSIADFVASRPRPSGG